MYLWKQFDNKKNLAKHKGTCKNYQKFRKQ